MVTPHLPGKFYANRSSRFARIQNVTDDRQTDRQTTHCAIGATDSTVGQRCKTMKDVIKYVDITQITCKTHTRGF